MVKTLAFTKGNKKPLGSSHDLIYIDIEERRQGHQDRESSTYALAVIQATDGHALDESGGRRHLRRGQILAVF